MCFGLPAVPRIDEPAISLRDRPEGLALSQQVSRLHGDQRFAWHGQSDSRAGVSPAAGWAASSSRAAIAAAALTPAARRQAALKPWKKALEAAAWTAFPGAGWPSRLVRLASSSAPPTESWAMGRRGR